MESYEFPVDDGTDWEEIEGIHEHVVDVLVVLVEALRKLLRITNPLHSALKLKKLVIYLHS